MLFIIFNVIFQYFVYFFPSRQQDYPPNGAPGADPRRMGGGIPAQDRGMYIPPPPDEAPPNPPSDHVRNKVAAFAAAAAAAQGE